MTTSDRPSDIQRTRYHFVGLVQNRGFRYACVQCALKTQVTGWVRNERDRSVTAEVQGTEFACAAWLHRLQGLVYGYGDQWSIGSSKRLSVRRGEEKFTVKF